MYAKPYFSIKNHAPTDYSVGAWSFFRRAHASACSRMRAISRA